MGSLLPPKNRRRIFAGVCVIALIWGGFAFANRPRVPSDEVERCELLLEIVRVRNVGRYYAYVDPDNRTIPILMEVARHDMPTIRAAAERFQEKAGPIGPDYQARREVVDLLAKIVWNVPSHQVAPLAFRDDSIEGVPRPSSLFAPDWAGQESRFGHLARRDLTSYAKQRLSRAELDEALLRSMKDVVYQNGHWNLRATATHGRSLWFDLQIWYTNWRHDHSNCR